MAKGKKRRAGTKNGVNKAQSIRDAAKEMGGKVRPKDIIAALAAKASLSVRLKSARLWLPQVIGANDEVVKPKQPPPRQMARAD